jgi:TBC1 domain family member 10
MLGVLFLFRVGLAIFACNRRQLLDLKAEDAVYECLMHPPPASFPSTDAFISVVQSIKLKEDDIRKQRTKMEAQLKRQTQLRAMSTTAESPASARRPLPV